jgi:hypothetical protein
MVLSGTRPILIGVHQLPSLEFDIQSLSTLAHNIDESQIVVERASLILASKAKHSFHFQMISQISLKFISIHHFMMGYLLVVLSMTMHAKYQRIQHISTSKCNKIEILAMLLFLVDSSADHNRTSKER